MRVLFKYNADAFKTYDKPRSKTKPTRKANRTSEATEEAIRREYTGERGQMSALAKKYSLSVGVVSRIVGGSGQAKRLTPGQINDLRAVYTGAYGEITTFARQYGVGVGAIRAAVCWKTWDI